MEQGRTFPRVYTVLNHFESLRGAAICLTEGSHNSINGLPDTLLNRQLLLLRRVGCSPAGSLIRKDTRVADTAIPVVVFYVRRVGKPRRDWMSQVIAEAVRRCGSGATMDKALVDKGLGGERRWRQLLRVQPLQQKVRT